MFICTNMFICTTQYPQVYLSGTMSVRRTPARFAQFSGFGDSPADGIGKEQGRLGSFHLGGVEATGAVPGHVDPGVQS